MLVVTKKENETITIEPGDGVDPALTLREVFAHGPIVLKLTHVGKRRVHIVVEAPSALKILRSETPALASVDAEPSCESPQQYAGSRR